VIPEIFRFRKNFLSDDSEFCRPRLRIFAAMKRDRHAETADAVMVSGDSTAERTRRRSVPQARQN
jgi:hypothetical protein